MPAVDLDLSKKPRKAGLGGEDLKLQDRAATITLVHDGRTGRVHMQNRFPVFMKSDAMGECIHYRFELSEPFAVPRNPQSRVCYLAGFDLALLKTQLEMESRPRQPRSESSYRPRF